LSIAFPGSVNIPLLEYGSQSKVLLQNLAKEVKVTGDEVLLTYTVPLSPRRVSEEKAGVLSTVHYGGPTCTIDRTFTLTFSLDK